MKHRMTHQTRARKHSSAKRGVPPPPDTGDRLENPPALPARLDADTRRAMIAEAAYYRAEQRGFEPGHEPDDWYGAESDIDSMPRPFEPPFCCGP
jgi:hypothetical protein